MQWVRVAEGQASGPQSRLWYEEERGAHRCHNSGPRNTTQVSQRTARRGDVPCGRPAEAGRLRAVPAAGWGSGSGVTKTSSNPLIVGHMKNCRLVPSPEWISCRVNAISTSCATQTRDRSVSPFRAPVSRDGFRNRVACFGPRVGFFFPAARSLTLRAHSVLRSLLLASHCLSPSSSPIGDLRPSLPHARPSPSPSCAHMLSCCQLPDARAATWGPGDAGHDVVMCLDAERVWCQRYQAPRVTNPICSFGLSCLSCSAEGPQRGHLLPIVKACAQARPAGPSATPGTPACPASVC